MTGSESTAGRRSNPKSQFDFIFAWIRSQILEALNLWAYGTELSQANHPIVITISSELVLMLGAARQHEVADLAL
jgi:hypothetical protein